MRAEGSLLCAAASVKWKASRFPTPRRALTSSSSARPSRGERNFSARLASEKKITGGLALSRYYKDRPNDFLVCVTETNSRQEIDALVEGLKDFNS